MAKDDYDVIAYRVLVYLYGCMKREIMLERPAQNGASFNSGTVPGAWDRLPGEDCGGSVQAGRGPGQEREGAGDRHRRRGRGSLRVVGACEKIISNDDSTPLPHGSFSERAKLILMEWNIDVHRSGSPLQLHLIWSSENKLL